MPQSPDLGLFYYKTREFKPRNLDAEREESEAYDEDVLKEYIEE